MEGAAFFQTLKYEQKLWGSKAPLRWPSALIWGRGRVPAGLQFWGESPAYCACSTVDWWSVPAVTREQLVTRGESGVGKCLEMGLRLSHMMSLSQPGSLMESADGTRSCQPSPAGGFLSWAQYCSAASFLPFCAGSEQGTPICKVEKGFPRRCQEASNSLSASAS